MSCNRTVRSAVSLACVAALVGCGGGGGGADSSPQSTPAESPLLGISASNYQAVGQAAVSSALYLGNTGSVVTGAEAGSDPRLLRQAVDAARRALAAVNGKPAVVTGAEVRETVPCSQGGSLAVAFNDGNNNGNPDVGDTITLDAQACKEDGALLQGRIALSLQALTGVYDSSNFSATLTMTLTAFSAASGTDSVQGDGNLSLAISQTPAGVGELTLSTSRLVLSGRVAGQNFSTTLVDNKLTLRSETVGGVPRATVTYASSLTSTNFGNKQVNITTVQPLVVTGTNLYPSSGQLLVRGNANSAVRITAVNATQARLELDAEGDGTYETQVLKTWAELQ